MFNCVISDLTNYILLENGVFIYDFLFDKLKKVEMLMFFFIFDHNDHITLCYFYTEFFIKAMS